MTTSERHLIVQISDIHLVPTGEFKPGVAPLLNLDAALRRLRDAGLRPDAVLLTGDLTDGGDAASYAALRTAVEDFAGATGAAIVALAGNHDARPALRSHLLGLDPTDEPLYHVTSVRGLRLVALDSSIPGEIHGALDEHQLLALREELATPSPAGTLVAIHHPPIPSPLPTMNEFGLRQPERLAEAIEGSDVLMVVAGHDHHASCGFLAGIPVWVGPSTAYQLDPLVTTGGFAGLVGLEGSALSRIDVADGRAVATVVPVAGSFAPLAADRHRDVRDELPAPAPKATGVNSRG